MGPGGASRRNSAAEIGGRSVPAEAIKKGETPSGGGGSNALGFGASKPVTVSKECLPLAPFQLVTFYDKRRTAEFLTFTEAISLMLACTDMHRAIKDDPLLRLDEISLSFQALGCYELARSIQTIEAEISELQRQAGVMAGTPADLAKRSISFAGLSFQIRRSPKAQQAARQAQERETKAQGAQLTAWREALEPVVEDLVFHFASERMKGPRLPGAAAQMYAPPAKIARRLHDAIDKGDAELVRAGLREFLSLPERLMPNARKVAWLREPQGTCTLEFFGQYRCDRLLPSERRQYEAIMAYVDEIVISNYLSPFEKRQLIVKLERVRIDPLSGAETLDELDIVAHAASHNNPAVAASILLGIHGSRADPELKQFLLSEIAASWKGGLGKCVERVAELLAKFHPLAPDWVDDVIARLKSMRPALAAEQGLSHRP
jgi:hypothetical protein